MSAHNITIESDIHAGPVECYLFMQQLQAVNFFNRSPIL